MALKFEKKEIVEFGDIRAELKNLDTETKLRLQMIQLDTAEGIIEATKALSECFTSKTAEIADFMIKNMSDYDLRRLQVYILKGPQMLKELGDGLREMMIEEVKNA